MNPTPTDIFGRLRWLTDRIKRIFGNITLLDQRVTALENGGGGGGDPLPPSVTQIIDGDGISITPAEGTGTVTISTVNIPSEDSLSLLSGIEPVNLPVGSEGLGGFYAIDTTDDGTNIGGVIEFPDPALSVGKVITIMNRSTYNAPISNNGYMPIDVDGSPVLYVPSSSVYEFISTANDWYTTFTRTI